MKPTNEIGFRVSFARLFGSTLLNLAILLAVFFVIYIVLGLLQNQAFRIPPANVVLLLVTVVPVLSAVYAFLESRRPRAYLSQQGIRLRDTWGRLYLTTWDAIKDIRVESRPGTQVLVFYTTQRHGDLVLPMMLDDLQGFRDTAARFAGAGNPLVKSLDTLAKQDQ